MSRSRDLVRYQCSSTAAASTSGFSTDLSTIGPEKVRTTTSPMCSARWVESAVCTFTDMIELSGASTRLS